MRSIWQILLGGVALWLAIPLAAMAQDKPIVAVETSMGTFKVELDDAKAPITVKNFLQYVGDKHYDGTIIHRVTNNPPVIQGGGFEPGMKEKKYRDSIKNESDNGLSNVRGTIAMARQPDPDSAKAQFYVNWQDNLQLDGQKGKPGYAVFGKVIEGMDVVDKISKVSTRSVGTFRNVPEQDVVVKTIRRVNK
jgi:cyclophilin family peptidyl-prolyl cis-trans isomerase